MRNYFTAIASVLLLVFVVSMSRKATERSPSQPARTMASVPPSALDQETPAAVIQSSQRALKEIESLEARKDPMTGQIRTLVAPKITLFGQNGRERADDFVNRFAYAMFGVNPENLKISEVRTGDQDRVIYHEIIKDHPVYGASLVVVMKGDHVERVQNDLAPLSSAITDAPSLTVEAAQKLYHASEAQFREQKGLVGAMQEVPLSLFLYPSQDRLVWAYELQVTAGSESYRVLVNGETGQTITRHSNIID